MISVGDSQARGQDPVFNRGPTGDVYSGSPARSVCWHSSRHCWWSQEEIGKGVQGHALISGSQGLHGGGRAKESGLLRTQLWCLHIFSSKEVGGLCFGVSSALNNEDDSTFLTGLSEVTHALHSAAYDIRHVMSPWRTDLGSNLSRFYDNGKVT